MQHKVVLAIVVLGVLSVFLSCCVSAQKPIIPHHYPEFEQCDPRWGNITMGDQRTICDTGCAMCSLSSALNGRGYKIDDDTVITPKTMDHWLQRNYGYECVIIDNSKYCDNLNLTAPQQISKGIKFISEKEKPDLATLKLWVKKSNPIAIAHVRHNTHFVLLTGFFDDVKNTSFIIMDPNFLAHHQTTYDYSDISDIITYFVADKQ